jgi:hypothetical protein
VTLPQGALWQRMRQRAVDAVPAGSNVEFKSPVTLAAWQAQGTYTISSVSPSRFAIVVAPSDFGGALFSDAAFHLDHALEHQASLMKVLESGQWSSPAWQVVTFYYWSYFCAMALSRLLGRTVWFVTPHVAEQFTALAARGGHRVTRGTYELSCGVSLSAGAREIALVKRPRRLHEQLWSTVFDLLESVYREVGAGVAAPQEERLYLAIMSSARILGNDWPSSIRNVVNYRPGFAYTAPRFKSSIDSFMYLSMQKQTIDGLIDRLENNNIVMRNDPRVEAHPKIVARMLVDLTLLISRIANALHDELVDRSGLDRRWLVSKRRFAQQQGIISTGVPWPC